MIPRFLLAAALAVIACAGVASAVPLTGQVVDRAGKPVEFANLVVAAQKRGTVTDEQGRFEIDLPPGRHAIEVAQLGYRRLLVEVEAGTPLTLVLEDEPVPIGEVTVTASTFGKSGKFEGAVVRRGDVISTPGGAADIFQSLRALPGINAPNEGAAVYVRGGHPRETLIRVDGVEVGHPYHYEGASGGLFSTVDSYMLKSALFSSGGFGARYGGVLSGVLDIETQDPLNLRTVSVGANLAGGTAATSWALIPDKLSFVGSVNHSVPALLFKLYGSASDYETAPSSSNGFAKLIHRYSPTGRITASYLEAHDHVGLVASHLNAAYLYDDVMANHVGTLEVRDVLAGRMAWRGLVSRQSYDKRWSYGPFGAGQSERTTQANLDFDWPVSTRAEVSFGLNARRRATEIVGDFPADSMDVQPGAPIRHQVTRPTLFYPGVYAEGRFRLWGPVYATLGGRADHLSRPDRWTTDPRAALAWLIGTHQTVRVAAGRYHQPADPEHLNPVYGNPDLGPLRADHLIAGYEWRSEFGNMRVEGYRKVYHGLVTQDSVTFYSNRGHGYARGIDAFVQGTYRALSGWVSYGYLDTRRKELDDPEEVPAAYGVRHTLSLVSQLRATRSITVGARYTFSSGRPFTPVLAATYDAKRGVWHPVYGDRHSARFPDYQRLDVRLTKLFSIPAGAGLPASGVCAFYIEGLNVLGVRNVLDYVYSPDYSIRYRTDSYFSRAMPVAGFTLSW
ncbi:MAG TPA: TonB-dependent receptor [Candidatus Eisenbacteria bacterium]|nr:TonB-dependent receptor [Candidatus Eisenbacteria bacterium]